MTRAHDRWNESCQLSTTSENNEIKRYTLHTYLELQPDKLNIAVKNDGIITSAISRYISYKMMIIIPMR